VTSPDPTRKTTSLSEQLEPFRSHEPVHAAAVVIEDVDAKRVLAAWTTMPLEPWRASRTRPKSEVLSWRWEWIWSSVQVDFSMLGLRAGVSPQTAQSKFELLRAARLVYPDGTISKPALLVLQAYVQQNLPKQPKQAAQPKKETPDGNR
jgi:hypothetical protein